MNNLLFHLLITFSYSQAPKDAVISLVTTAPPPYVLFIAYCTVTIIRD